MQLERRPFPTRFWVRWFPAGQVVSNSHEQKFMFDGKGVNPHIPGYDPGSFAEQSVTVAKGGLRVSQCASDSSIARKLYNTFGDLTMLEPVVTGVFKASIRDNSDKKSPFIAFDKNWSLRFDIR